MPAVRFNALTKKRASTRRRRSSVMTRAKFKPKTTTANRSLIKGNAYAIRSLRRLMPPPIYCDYQYSGANGAFTTVAPAPFLTIVGEQLMSPVLWNSVLRQDQNVETASSTLVKRMQLNLRYSLQQANYCQITTFVVSLRPNATNVVPNNLTAGEDYIYSQGQQMNPRLNSKIFKVHYVRNVSLMANGWLQPKAEVAGQVITGNPNTTFAKGQVTMKLNWRLREPSGGLSTWRTMDQSQFGPHRRLFLLTFYRGQQDDPADLGPQMDWDAQYVTFNSS